MDLNTALYYGAGLLILLITLQVLAAPAEFVFRLAFQAAMGGGSLWVLNAVAAPLGFHIGLNPVSAALVGLLGLPGLLGLSLISLITR